MRYPTVEQVEKADRIQLAKWYRFLRSPKDQEEVDVSNRITERFQELGFFSPEISKLIGWED